MITAGHKSARLEARMLGTYEPLGASDTFDLTRVSDPSARIISGETVLKDHADRPIGTVNQVVLGANYTILRYRGTSAVAGAESLEVKADGRVLGSYGELAPMRYLADGQELVFGPVPPGALTLEIRHLGEKSGLAVEERVESDTGVKWNGAEAVVTVDIPLVMDAPWRDATLLTDGPNYKGEVREVGRQGLQVLYEVRSDPVPPGTVIRAVQLWADRMFPGPPVSIDL